MSLDSPRRIPAILRILDEAGRPLGGAKIARRLSQAGIRIEQRMVRNYLEAMDAAGLTTNLGRRGRQLTDHGRRELAASDVVEKVGFIDARSDELAYHMTLDLKRSRGTLILNVSTLPAAFLDDARRAIEPVVRARLGMGHLGLVARTGDGVPGLAIAAGQAVLGTVCAITLNGLLRAAGIPVVSKFGGLLELRDGQPLRFTHLIHYAGTTLDPIEIFIKAGMTSVLAAARTGCGLVGASFREVPAAALADVRKVVQQMDEAGLCGTVLMGPPNLPLLDVPVAYGRAGLVVMAGLNPLAAVEEAGIPTENRALARLGPLEDLVPLV